MLVSHNTRRHLPHIERPGAAYFVSFSSFGRWTLPSAARDIALTTIVREHGVTCWLECGIVMPDHVHLIVQPYESHSLHGVLQTIKSVSAHRIKATIAAVPRVWQEESFDRVLRSNESQRIKAEYVVMNPVRKGLCATPDAYPWLWRAWVEGSPA